MLFHVHNMQTQVLGLMTDVTVDPQLFIAIFSHLFTVFMKGENNHQQIKFLKIMSFVRLLN
jgi:hypothetical protein